MSTETLVRIVLALVAVVLAIAIVSWLLLVGQPQPVVVY